MQSKFPNFHMSFLYLSQMEPPIDEASGQVDIFFSDLWVMLTFGQMYPPVEASSGQELYYFRSTSHLVSF